MDYFKLYNDTYGHLAGGVAALQIQHSKAPGVQCVTLSAGCATTVPGRGTALMDFIVKVDSALYEAKRQGRNRTILA